MDPRNLSDEKLATLLRFLVSFGYIDGTFDQAEQRFVATYLNGLLEALVERATPDPRRRAEVKMRVSRALDAAYERVADEIEGFADEGPRDETPGKGESFLYTRLKVRCVEL